MVLGFCAFIALLLMNPIATKNKPRSPNRIQAYVWDALHFFGMDESHTILGLRHLKQEARHRFREYAKKYHPDRNNCRAKYRPPCNGWGLRQAIRYYNVLRNLEVVPITPQNMIAVLEITKGYLTTADVDVPGVIL